MTADRSERLSSGASATEEGALAAGVQPSGAVREASADAGELRRQPAPLESRPADWPGEGPIDLAVHDCPHGSATTEWWYLNTHVTGESGKRYALFTAFFRQVRRYDSETREPVHMHSVAWAVADLDAKKYRAHSGVDPLAPAEGMRIIEEGLGATDKRWNRALSEILKRGSTPYPDQLMEGEVCVALDRLELQYGLDTLRKLDDGSYELHLQDKRFGIGCHLVFQPRKPPIRHGVDGVVPGSQNEAMFYYFIPRHEVAGEVTFEGRTEKVSGRGWYDHEFGVGEVYALKKPGEKELDPEEREKRADELRKRLELDAIGWDWFSMQLEDGTDVSIYDLRFLIGEHPAGSYVVISDPEGNPTVYTEVQIEPTRDWKSTRTFVTYPVAWKVRVPEAGLELEVEGGIEDQEFVTLVTRYSFWEGDIHVRGTLKGRAVEGRGIVERSGYGGFETLDAFFESVGKVVRHYVAQSLPREPSPYMAEELIGSHEHPHYVDGVDLSQFGRTLIGPIRDIVDRGGKGWRSYALITCCDLVGGDSRDFIEWIAYPEVMHVGSLIVDDVQDKSTWRRGGPTVNVIYGDAQAINSGTAAYFLCTSKMQPESLTARQRLRVFDYFFEGLRAGHAGQAIDLDGFEDILPQVVETGDAAQLERRVRAVHRLKTAAPAGCLARMGAVMGGGNDAQIEGLGLFFEAVGLAFQALDDVLNLRGFKKDLKTRAEDITHGKVTLPVAKALGRLDKPKRKWLVDILHEHVEDLETLSEAVDLLEKCGAIQDCVDEAHSFVEQEWGRLDPLVEDSVTKVMLRAFSWYLLERHY